MDAHTLNAWTRFALQKGGIGTCTALIDNPATDQEDLMFMTGEKIIVLRRLDDDDNTTNGKRRSGAAGGPTDADAWFLGYCEGVVGRFKGGHVQFHGKLKKPVLMRRSGAGSVRESSSATTRPISKSELVHMHASQVPPGMPISSVLSDEEESLVNGHAKSKSGSGAQTDPVAAATAALNGTAPGGYPRNASTTPTKETYLNGHAHSNPSSLGITTPPLSDETHKRTGSLSNDDAESDVSESLLPWARRSTASSAASGSLSAPRAGGAGNAAGTSTGGASMWGKAGLKSVAHLNTSNLPPSPISSNESPIHAKLDNPQSHFAPLGRVRGQAHLEKSPSASSSRSTTDSEEDASFNRRRDYTFSIYDVYNRDSVAFPNFSLTSQGISPRASPRNSPPVTRSELHPPPSSSQNLVASTSNLRLDTTSLSNSKSRSGDENPLTPKDPRRPSDPTPSASTSAGLAMRAAARRPSAAPDPRAPPNQQPGGLSPAFQQQQAQQPPVPSAAAAAAAAAAAPGSSIQSAPAQNQRPTAPAAAAVPGSLQQQSSPERQGPGTSGTTTTFGGFDPRRRPSAPAAAANAAAAVSGLNAPQPPAPAPVPGPGPGPGRGPGAVPGAVRQDVLPVVSGQMGFRGPPPGPGTPGSIGPGGMPTSFGNRAPTAPTGPPGGPTGGFPMGVRPSLDGAPHRSSSDRTSERERGSWQLKKNPSNPLPGAAGGSRGSNLSLSITPNGLGPGGAAGNMGLPPPGSAGGPSTRSPSPMSLLGTSPGAYSAPGGMGSPAMLPGTPTSGRFMGGSSPIPSPGPPPGPGSVRGSGVPAAVPLKFDSLGFVAGSGPDFLPPRDDPEVQEAWHKILSDNDLPGARKSRKVKKMVRDGIPASVRGRVWLFLANSSVRRRPGLFEMLCKQSQASKGKKGKEAAYAAIEKDVSRSFPDHKLFIGENSTGKADLEAILKAYVHFNPFVGYTQGMGQIAGIFMLQMPPEDAFWLLCALLREPHMEGYYTNNLKQLHVDGVVFGRLLQHMDVEVYNRLLDLGLDTSHFAPNWFLPLFVRTLPWQTLLRVLDVFFFEGPMWILRVGLALVRILRDTLMDKRKIPGQGEALQLLLHPPQQLLTPENVMTCALSAKLKDGEVRKLSRNASKLVRQDLSNGRGRSMDRSGQEGGSRSTSAPARPRA